MRISDGTQIGQDETPLCVSVQTCGKTGCKGMSSRASDEEDQPQFTDREIADEARQLNVPEEEVVEELEEDSIGYFGQDDEEPSIFDLSRKDVQAHITVQGIAIGYGLLASVVYGKYKVLDRVLLGLGAVAFGAATYTGLKLGLDFKPSKHPVNYIVGGISGALSGLIAVGAVGAAINPKLIAKTAPEAVRKSIPL